MANNPYPDRIVKINGRIKCLVHGRQYIVHGVPDTRDVAYCTECSKEHYNSDGRCPVCGTKYGYAHGTGDCGCLG